MNSQYVVSENSTLQQAMEVITYNHKGTVIVVDEAGRVIGVVADGEIRRAILKGAIGATPLKKILNVNFVSVSAGDVEIRKNPEGFFLENARVQIAPVIDENNKLIDILIRGNVS